MRWSFTARGLSGVAVQTLLIFVAIAAASARAQSHLDSNSHASSAERSGTPASDAQRSIAEYFIPNVTLVRDDGKAVNLPAELNDGRPVVLNFVYTSCTTICPMSSMVFEQFQAQLGADSAGVHMVSISIDPEQDTPARLRHYAQQFSAGKDWNHYSGTLVAVTTVQRAFNAYRGDKMSHVPLTLLRAAPGAPWIRYDGFARADELMAERNRWSPSAASLLGH